MGPRLLISPGNEDNSWVFPIYIARKCLYAVHGFNLCFRFAFSWRIRKFSRPVILCQWNILIFLSKFMMFLQTWELCKLVCVRREKEHVFTPFTVHCTLCGFWSYVSFTIGVVMHFFFFLKWHWRILEPDQISYTQSMVAKRGHTNQANIYTLVT